MKAGFFLSSTWQKNKIVIEKATAYQLSLNSTVNIFMTDHPSIFPRT
jgi:hypothetical protein